MRSVSLQVDSSISWNDMIRARAHTHPIHWLRWKMERSKTVTGLTLTYGSSYFNSCHFHLQSAWNVVKKCVRSRSAQVAATVQHSNCAQLACEQFLKFIVQWRNGWFNVWPCLHECITIFHADNNYYDKICNVCGIDDEKLLMQAESVISYTNRWTGECRQPVYWQ